MALEHFLETVTTWKSHDDKSSCKGDGPTTSNTWSTVCHGQGRPHGDCLLLMAVGRSWGVSTIALCADGDIRYLESQVIYLELAGI